MSEDLQGTIMLVFFFVVPIIGIIILTMLNKKRKTKEYIAMAVNKELKVTGNAASAPQLPAYYVKFSYEKDGEKKGINIKVSEKGYKATPLNKIGTLSIRGSELLSFIGEDFSVDY